MITGWMCTEVVVKEKVCHTLAEDPSKARKVTDQWFGELLKACDSYLSAAILNEEEQGRGSIDEDECIRHLYTLGEITQLCPTRTPKRVFMLVQSLIAAPVITADDVPASQSESSQVSSQNGSQSPTKDPDHLGGSQQSVEGIGSQPLTQVLSQFRGSKMSSKIRAHAFIALGKLCLQNEDLAKKCVPAMARELETSTDLAVRNNVVIILSDLCIRYTTLVDRYVSNISACLKDETPLIRIQTLTLLTRLVQEDFLKWKGTLFFRVVSALIDEHKDVANFARFWLVHLLIRRHPGIFFHHFIECVFYFNSYDKHKVFNKVSETEREKKLFSLKGKANASKRMQLYRFLLEYMSDEHKFHLTAKLSKEIVGAVVDGLIPLDEDSSALLQDTLCILASKEIKLASMRTIAHDDPTDELERAAVVMDAAKKTLITQVFKRNVIENIVPTVVSLKHMLESDHSPVLKELMLFLRELMKDYKNEVKDILSADKQLAAEIEFDMRKFEEEEQQELERRRRRGRRSNTGTGTPTARSPADSPQGVGTPAAPATPQVAPTAAGTPPVLRIPAGTPVARLMGTPRGARVATPLSTLAIMNSARKALEKAKKVGQTANPPPPPVQTGRRPERDVRFEDTETPEVSTESEGFKTPDGKHLGKYRAISTPTMNLTLGNITFQQGDHNLSMIPPPSPIPSSMPGRFTSDQGAEGEPAGPSWSSRQDVDENGRPQQRDVIHMFSPDKPTPRIRPWNVQTPMTVNLENRPAEPSGKDGAGDAPTEKESADTRKRLRSDSPDVEQPAPSRGGRERKTRGKQRQTSEGRGQGQGQRKSPRETSQSAKDSSSAGDRRRSRRKK